MKIIKRNGKEMDFDRNKIVTAITKANNSVNPEAQMKPLYIEAIASDIEDMVNHSLNAMNVEDVQDAVVYKLMKQAPVVALCYQKYRYNRELIRKANTTDESILALINLENEDIKQENSNKNPTIVSVQRDYMAGEVSKDLTKRFFLTEEINKAHEEGIIHFHDSIVAQLGD